MNENLTPRKLVRPSFRDVTESRRLNMSAIRGEDTGPEMALRRLLFARGYRYRLHPKGLPGRPDIVFPGRRSAIEIRGCFWHRHGCKNSVLPKTRRDWWEQKLALNVARDDANAAALEAAGWRVLVVWECEVRASASSVLAKAVAFLGSWQVDRSR
jgi:DNA mismatch endonuclease Vsr